MDKFCILAYIFLPQQGNELKLFG